MKSTPVKSTAAKATASAPTAAKSAPAKTTAAKSTAAKATAAKSTAAKATPATSTAATKATATTSTAQKAPAKRAEPQRLLMSVPTPFPGPPAETAPHLEPLDEVRQRLAALDEVPLERHPAEFDTIDGLLRAALEGAGGSGVAGPSR